MVGGMVSDRKKLQAELAAVSIDDIDAVHDLFVRVRALAKKRGRSSDALHDVAELSRRAERAMGLALRSGQARGVVAVNGGDRTGVSAKKYVPSWGLITNLYTMASVSDEQFEKALIMAVCEPVAHGRIAGVPTRPLVLAACKELTAVPVPKGGRPSVRARRAVEDLAIQLNALAWGVKDVDPCEVDEAAVRSMVFQAFNDLAAIKRFLQEVRKQNDG